MTSFNIKAFEDVPTPINTFSDGDQVLERAHSLLNLMCKLMLYVKHKWKYDKLDLYDDNNNICTSYISATISNSTNPVPAHKINFVNQNAVRIVSTKHIILYPRRMLETAMLRGDSSLTINKRKQIECVIINRFSAWLALQNCNYIIPNCFLLDNYQHGDPSFREAAKQVELFRNYHYMVKKHFSNILVVFKIKKKNIQFELPYNLRNCDKLVEWMGLYISGSHFKRDDIVGFSYAIGCISLHQPDILLRLIKGFDIDIDIKK